MPTTLAVRSNRSGPERALRCTVLPALLAILIAACGTPEPADRVVLGATVVTIDPAAPRAEAIAMRDGRLVLVGSAAEARRLVGPRTEVLELDGGMVLPAFQDAHIHPVMSGVEVNQCDLAEAGDADAVFALVMACAERQQGEWLLGFGWDLPVFPGANPRAEWLEEIAPGRPAYLVAADGHSAWVSPRALELAGIDATTPDPPRGRIERDPATDAPTGTLREAAMELVREHVPPTPLDERLEGLALAQDLLLEHGVVAVLDADVYPEHLEAYRAAEQSGDLLLRVRAALHVDPERGAEQVDEFVAQREEFTSERLRPVAAKLYIDGVIEARTALMLEPYTDRPGDRGSPEWVPERLFEVAERLVDDGFDLHFHAIGDGAVRQALDVVERCESRGDDAGSQARHQISHLELIHPDDVPRFAALGVGANFQALWATADSYVVDFTLPGIGPERAQWLYPIGSVHRAGGRLAFGSDWSVSSLDPLDAIQVALTRRSLDGTTEPLLPDEAIDLETALTAYTLGAAWANGFDDDSGSLEVGKRADLVVLSNDLFTLPIDRIAEAQVLRTIIEGVDVYTAGTVDE